MNNKDIFYMLGVSSAHISFIELSMNLIIEKEKIYEYETPKYASFAGCYPFTNYLFPFDLAFLMKQKLLNFKHDIVGLVLPYPHGFDHEPLMGINRLDLQYLHLFNTGDASQKISGIVNGIAFKNVEVPYNKRITLDLNKVRKR